MAGLAVSTIALWIALGSSAETFEVPDSVFTAPVNSLHGFSLIRLQINHHSNQLFLIDSAFEFTSVSQQTANELKLKIDYDIPGKLVSETDSAPERINFAKKATVSYGRYDLFSGPMPIIDLSNLSNYLGVNIAGILGYDILSRHNFTLNLRSHTLSLLRSGSTKSSAPTNQQAPAIATCSSFPVISGRLQLEDIQLPLRLKVDTGSNVPLELYSPFVRAHHLTSDASRPLRLYGPSGSGREGTEAGKATLELPGMTLRLENVYMSSAVLGMSAETSVDGTLGSPALEGHILVFECGAGMVKIF